MTDRPGLTVLDKGVAQLREIAIASPAGDFIGSEDDLLKTLGLSRSTLRQAARLLEREGLVRVRRGIRGGYFSARPDALTVEAAVATQLQLLDVDTRDTVAIATALWVEAVRKAASSSNTCKAEAIEGLQRQLRAIGPEAGFAQLRDTNRDAQELIFATGRSSYIKLIFDINDLYASRRLTVPDPLAAAIDPATAQAWRDAKLIELQSVAAGEAELAAAAARLARTYWVRLIAARFGHASAYPPEQEGA